MCDATRDAVCITRSHWLPEHIPTNGTCVRSGGRVWRLTPGRSPSSRRAPERHLNEIRRQHSGPSQLPSPPRQPLPQLQPGIFPPTQIRKEISDLAFPLTMDPSQAFGPSRYSSRSSSVSVPASASAFRQSCMTAVPLDLGSS